MSEGDEGVKCSGVPTVLQALQALLALGAGRELRVAVGLADVELLLPGRGDALGRGAGQGGTTPLLYQAAETGTNIWVMSTLLFNGLLASSSPRLCMASPLLSLVQHLILAVFVVYGEWVNLAIISGFYVHLYSNEGDICCCLSFF